MNHPFAAQVHYFHARPRDGGVDEAKLAKHDPAVDGVLRLAAKEPGTHLIIAKASKAGMEDSELATGCFRLEPPSFLFAEVHDHELRSLHLPSECDEGPVPAKCSVCGAALANGDGYADRARDFAVCMARAGAGNERRFNVRVPRARVPESIHASRALRGMIARPKVGRNERNAAERGAFRVGKVAPLFLPRWSLPKAPTRPSA